MFPSTNSSAGFISFNPAYNKTISQPPPGMEAAVGRPTLPPPPAMAPIGVPPQNVQLPDLSFLNTGVNDPNKKVQYIVLIYSKYSPRSQELMRNISLKCKAFYRLLCIDDKEIRERVSKSSTIKITHVPSIIFIYNDGFVLTCEGDSCLDVVKNIEISQINNHGPNCQCHIHRQNPLQQKRSVDPMAVTSLASLMGGQGGEIEQSEQVAIPIDDDAMENEGLHPGVSAGGREMMMQRDQNTRDPRNVPRRVRQPPQYDEMDGEPTGMSSRRMRPIAGKGHETMARSSLKQFGNGDEEEEPKKKKKQLRMINADTIDDDLEEMLQEDPTIDPHFRGTMKGRKGGKDMKGVQHSAAQMIREREEEMEEMNGEQNEEADDEEEIEAEDYEDENVTRIM